MEKRKILVSFPPLTGDQREKIRKTADEGGFTAVFCDDPGAAEKEAEDAEIIFSFNKKLIGKAKDLKWFCTPSAGVDVFLDEVRGKDILLSGSSGSYGLTIAEHIVMTTLEILRRRPDYLKLKEERIWEQHLPIRSLYGSRVTFVGTGNIGTEAAKRIKAFKPKCMVGVNRRGNNPENVYDKIVSLNELDEVLPETDILILSLPATKDTVGILTEERMRMLPEGSYIVNVGRGNVLDQTAIEKLLREGRLGGAALDVFEKEPLDKESTLWDCPRLILTTHVSGNWTIPYTVEKIVSLFTADLENYINGRPLKQIVDLDAGYDLKQ